MRRPLLPYLFAAALLFSALSIIYYGTQIEFSKKAIIPSQRDLISKLKSSATQVSATSILSKLEESKQTTKFKSLKIRNLTDLKIDSQDLGKVFLGESDKEATITVMDEDNDVLMIEIKIEQQGSLESELTLRVKR